jgi:hypothetical protein
MRPERQCRLPAQAAVNPAPPGKTENVEAKPFLVALVLGAGIALFIHRDRAAALFPKGENLPDKLGMWMVQITIAMLAVIGLAYMLSE